MISLVDSQLNTGICIGIKEDVSVVIETVSTPCCFDDIGLANSTYDSEGDKSSL